LTNFQSPVDKMKFPNGNAFLKSVSCIRDFVWGLFSVYQVWKHDHLKIFHWDWICHIPQQTVTVRIEVIITNLYILSNNKYYPCFYLELNTNFLDYLKDAQRFGLQPLLWLFIPYDEYSIKYEEYLLNIFTVYSYLKRKWTDCCCSFVFRCGV
jgi:hypothetical protein